MKIWVLDTVEYDTYSYCGLSPSKQYFFLRQEAALNRAEELELTVREYCQSPDDCVIYEVEVEE